MIDKNDALARLPTGTITALERKIATDFQSWTFDLTSNERWTRYYQTPNQPGLFHRHLEYQKKRHLEIVREFAGDYTTLLERAVVEYARQLGPLLQRIKSPLKDTDRQEILSAAFKFAQRFTVNEYERPWQSLFLLPPAESQDMPSQRTLSVDFQRGNALSWLFSEAERRVTPEIVKVTFLQEIENGEWKDRAVRKVSDELLLATARTRGMVQTGKLTEREKKIAAVIHGGSKGLQYCRELDNARIAPLRSGVWKDCPSRKYQSIYKEGGPWPHRIQDEKSRICRKVKLADE